jgi:hypothetical protein
MDRRAGKRSRARRERCAPVFFYLPSPIVSTYLWAPWQNLRNLSSARAAELRVTPDGPRPPEHGGEGGIRTPDPDFVGITA